VEKALGGLQQRITKASSESQRRSYESQAQSKSGQLERARDAQVRAEQDLSKAEEKLGTAESKLREEEQKDRDSARRKEEQERKRQEQKDRLEGQRKEREAKRLETERAAREALQDQEIGVLHGRAAELEERLIESERKAAPPEVTVLFLAASPRDEPPLRLDKETREIQKRMRASEFRDSIFIEWRLARQLPDLIQDLNEVQPDVLHFSGHGNEAALAFEDDAGNSIALTNEQLDKLFAAAPNPIRLVVFNSCNSAVQAELAVKHVAVAVGMEATVGDREAQTFAGQFYNSLGFGNSIGQAFEQARFQTEVEHGKGFEVPKLFSADGVDPQTVILVNPDS